MSVDKPTHRRRDRDDTTLTKRKPLVELFAELLRPYGIPPTPLHEALHEALQQAGWQFPSGTLQQRQRAAAHGRTIQRGQDLALRRLLVAHVFKQLLPHLKEKPGSQGTAQAIINQLRKLKHKRNLPMTIRTIQADIAFMRNNGNFGI